MFKNMKKAFVADDTDQQTAGENEQLLDDPTTVSGEHMIARGGTNIARTVAPTSVVFYEDYFKLNEVYERVIYLESWPVEVSPNWLRPIYQYPRAIDISIYYQPLPVKALLNKLRSKSARESSEIEKDEREGNPVDFARIQRLEDSLTLQEMLQRGETKPFQIALIIALRANTLKELNEVTQAIEKQIDAVNARTRRASLRQRDAFLSVMPFGRNYIADGYSTRNMQTAGAQYSFPFANADLTHPDGIWYGVNNSTNSNVILDRFLLNSPHSVVLGSTGSGKSYAAKLEMIRALMHGMPVMVIDPDAECQRLCEYVGGQFINIGPASEDRINVLDFSHIADGIEDQLTPKIQSVMRLIGTMMNPDGSGYGLNPEQVQIIDQLIREVYMEFGYTQDPRTQVHAQSGRMPVLSMLRSRFERFIRESEHDPRSQGMIRQIVASMGPYCTGGTFASLFDQHTTVDLSAQFVVFNIKPLGAARDKQIMTLGMHSVLEFIWNTTMNRKQATSGVQRLLFVDEAHVMMRSLESAQFLEDMLRQARKCGVGVTVLTQEPEDFVRPDRPQGKVIFGQTSMQLLLRMKRKSLEQLQEMMGLDDTEVDLLSNAERGQGMLFAMSDRVWISMDTASPIEHDMITTNPTEVAQIMARKEQAQGAYARVDEPLGLDPRQEAQRALPAVDPREAHYTRAEPIRPTIGQPEAVSQLGPPISQTEAVRRNGPPKPLTPARQQPPMPAPGGDERGRTRFNRDAP
jgi:conjugal transfer ATP-binding protein TraC